MRLDRHQQETISIRGRSVCRDQLLQIEAAGREQIDANALGPLDVSRAFWELLHRDKPFDTGWGYHVSPMLFFTVSGLLHPRSVSAIRSKTFAELVPYIQQAGWFEQQGLFELGGSFLNLVARGTPDATHPRSYDARSNPIAVSD